VAVSRLSPESERALRLFSRVFVKVMRGIDPASQASDVQIREALLGLLDDEDRDTLELVTIVGMIPDKDRR
jgi:hypothetical protein